MVRLSRKQDLLKAANAQLLKVLLVIDAKTDFASLDIKNRDGVFADL